MEKNFELVSVENEGTLEIGSYELFLESIKNYIDSNKVFLIQDKADLKLAKETRADINKKIKAIDRFRIDSIEDFVSLFAEQCKTITALLNEHQKAFGEAIKTYEEQQKSSTLAKPKVITATVKFYDAKVIEKLQQFAQENGCELTIKE
jgi:hypothetical protein